MLRSYELQCNKYEIKSWWFKLMLGIYYLYSFVKVDIQLKTCDYIHGGPQNCPYFSLAITFAKIKNPSRFLSAVAGSL